MQKAKEHPETVDSRATFYFNWASSQKGFKTNRKLSATAQTICDKLQLIRDVTVRRGTNRVGNSIVECARDTNSNDRCRSSRSVLSVQQTRVLLCVCSDKIKTFMRYASLKHVSCLFSLLGVKDVSLMLPEHACRLHTTHTVRTVIIGFLLLLFLVFFFQCSSQRARHRELSREVTRARRFSCHGTCWFSLRNGNTTTVHHIQRAQ